MAVPTGTQSTFAPVNLAGLLLSKTDVRTPLFNMLAGARTVNSKEFVVGADYELASAENDAISEDTSVTAPDPSYDTLTQIKNVTQIGMKSVRATYRKQSDTDSLTGLHLAGQSNNVTNPLAFALAGRTAEMRNNMEYVLINGEYNLATSTAEIDKTRGFNEAITTNIVAAGGEELGWDMLVSMARALASYSPYGLGGILGVLNAEQVVQLQKLVTQEGLKINYGAAGSNIYTVQTPFGVLNFLEGGHRHQANGTAGFYRMSSAGVVFNPVPEKGAFFYEPLAKTGASEHGQIYTQWGLDHGHEWLSGKITGIATTTADTTAPQVYITNDTDNPVRTWEIS